MAFLPFALMGLGFGMQALGSYRQAQSTKAALEYNQEVADIRAGTAIKESAFKADIEAQRQRRLRGKQEALFAKSGTLMTGSPLDVLADQALTDEMNLMAIRYGGESTAYNQRSQAELYGAQAKEQGTAGNVKLLGNIASGAGSMYMGYNKLSPDYDWANSPDYRFNKGD